MDPSITIHTRLPDGWLSYRAIRLEALKNDPEAYSSDYEVERAKDDSYWQERYEQRTSGETGTMLFACQADIVVGMAGADWSVQKRLRHIATLGAVFVIPQFRGKRIGELLVTKMLETLHANHGIEKVQLTVTMTQTAAKALYEKLGFRTVGVLEHEMKTQSGYLDCLFMEKLL
jgi:ribosomal protein S18 acetylase RimI-like enzyme